MKKLLVSSLIGLMAANLSYSQYYNIYNSSPIDNLTIDYQYCIIGSQCVNKTAVINKNSVTPILVNNSNQSTVFNILKASVTNSTGSYQYSFPTYISDQKRSTYQCTDQVGDFLLMPFDNDKSILCIANRVAY